MRHTFPCGDLDCGFCETQAEARKEAREEPLSPADEWERDDQVERQWDRMTAGDFL